MRLILVAVLVAAQPPQSFADLGDRVHVGQQVRVEDRSGRQISGKLTMLSPDAITVDSGGREWRFPRDTITSVERRGGYAKRGALIGAAAGAVAFVPFTQGEHGDADAPFLGALLGAGAGSITGALIPRMTTVYRADAATSASDLSLAPEVSRERVGMTLVLRW